MVPFFSPLGYISANAGPEGGEEPSEKEVLRLIQIRLSDAEFGENSPICQTNSRQARIAASSSIEAVSFFIRTHNKALSVVAMCVGNPPVGISFTDCC